MRLELSFGAALLAVIACTAAAFAPPAAPKGPLNTTADIRQALRGCWRWPPVSKVRSGMALTVRLSFKRNGEILGAQITYETPGVSDEERSLYHGALFAALARCSPLPLSESLGEAIAGRPMTLHIRDTRQQRKA